MIFFVFFCFVKSVHLKRIKIEDSDVLDPVVIKPQAKAIVTIRVPHVTSDLLQSKLPSKIRQGEEVEPLCKTGVLCMADEGVVVADEDGGLIQRFFSQVQRYVGSFLEHEPEKFKLSHHSHVPTVNDLMTGGIAKRRRFKIDGHFEHRKTGGNFEHNCPTRQRFYQ